VRDHDDSARATAHGTNLKLHDLTIQMTLELETQLIELKDLHLRRIDARGSEVAAVLRALDALARGREVGAVQQLDALLELGVLAQGLLLLVREPCR